jgi:hypothetical protein
METASNVLKAVVGRLNEDDRRAYEAAENAYARKSVLRYSLRPSERAQLYGPGDPHETKSYELVLEDWAPEVEVITGEPTGYTCLVGGRPLGEILRKLSVGLSDAGLIVDEYFDVGTDARLTRNWDHWPSNVFRVAVFAVEGGSEGHYVHVDVYTRDDPGGELKVTNVFLLKTFLGMEHALRLSNELTRMLEKAQ